MGDEFVHLLWISCENEDSAGVVVFHFLYDCVDCFAAVVVAFADERVGFVDEDDPSPGLLDFFFDHLGSPAYVFADDISASAFDKFVFGDSFAVVENLAEQAGYGSFGAAGIASEDHMEFLGFVGNPFVVSDKADSGGGNKLVDCFFYFIKSDQAVKLIDCFFEGFIAGF